MAAADHVGLSCECPHCYSQLQVPEAAAVNKDSFVEPPGLRRVLREVRDREWEAFRRKLKAAHARVSELETELHRAQSALDAGATAPAPSDDKGKEIEQLRRQLAEVGDKFAMANQAFMAGRKQQDTVIEHLRRELETTRGESQGLRKKNEDLARQLQSAQQKLESSRASSVSSEELARLQQELDLARTQLTEARCELDAEQAKVVLMEAAAIGVDESAPAKADAILIEDLKLQIAAFRQDNGSLRAARDSAHKEAAELRKKIAEADDHSELEAVLRQLQGGVGEALELVAKRKSSHKA